MNCDQVVPRLDPGYEAISSLATDVAEELRRLHGVTGVVETWERFARGTVATTAARGAAILHYVGYGYHARGVPTRLAGGWMDLGSRVPASRRGVFFHEVFASGPPWRSSFWLLPLQRSIARRILRASAVAVTSLDLYARMLARLEPGRRIDVLPIPSTVGEPGEVPELGGREPSLVVFGSAGVRSRAYGRNRSSLERAVRELGISRVVDLGPGEVAPDRIADVEVRRRGRLERFDLSRELLESRFGFLAYPPDLLGKSTVFAAMLAHGVVPLVAWHQERSFSRAQAADGWVHAGVDGLRGSRDFESIVQRGRSLYAERSVSSHAAFWKDRLLAP